MSQANQDLFLPFYSALMIGPDKLNQAKHVRFFEENNLSEHMRKHADIVKPKFDLVDAKLRQQNFGTWTTPNGGYFLLYKAKEGFAKKIISLAGEIGLKLTPAGATHPYGVDAEDAYIRIAPTACSLEELNTAMDVFLCCVGVAEDQASK